MNGLPLRCRDVPPSFTGDQSPSGVTVIGNLAVDRVDDRPPSAGGCPSFVGVAFERLHTDGRILTKRAARDAELFAETLAALPVPVTVLDARATSAFELRYHGDQRTLTVDAIGDPWTPADIDQAAITTRWVHIAPLLRSDFPAPTLAALAAAGHTVAYDGQGLVRSPTLGRLRTDSAFDPAILEHISVLKVDDAELQIAAGGLTGEAAARALGVREILVTFGSGGSDIYIEGEPTHVPAAWKVEGVQSTGAGDMFTIAYVAARSSGAQPLDAATAASELVASVLAARRSLSAPAG